MYATVADLRAEGVAPTTASDARLEALVGDAGAYVDSVTGWFFEPRSLTLRFDLGRLTIHDGAVGVPSLTMCGDLEALRRLADVPLTRWLRLPGTGVFSRRDPGSFRDLLGQYFSGNLKVYGLAAHPRTFVRLLRIFSSRS